MDLTQILLSIFHGTNLFALRVSFWATALPDSAICSKIGFFYEPLGAFFLALATLKFCYFANLGYFSKFSKNRFILVQTQFFEHWCRHFWLWCMSFETTKLFWCRSFGVLKKFGYLAQSFMAALLGNFTELFITARII